MYILVLLITSHISEPHTTVIKRSPIVTQSRIIRPTRTRRQNLDSHSPRNRREHILINPILPFRGSIKLTPRLRRFGRINIIRRGPTLERPTRSITLQGLVVLVLVKLIEGGAFDMTLRRSVFAEGGEVEHGDDAGFDGS